MMRLFVFYGLIFALFGIYISQYLTLCREAYKLWLQEIVYNRHIKDGSEKPELFSKIESLAKELCRLSDAICFLFRVFCITFYITASATIWKLNSIDINTSNETTNMTSLGLLQSALNNSEYMILATSLILSTILFASMPKFLSYVRINIMHPDRTSKIDEKLFYVWYKYRCFEHKQSPYRLKLQPIRLYQILACKKSKETFNGKMITIYDKEIESALDLEENEIKKSKRCKEKYHKNPKRPKV